MSEKLRIRYKKTTAGGYTEDGVKEMLRAILWERSISLACRRALMRKEMLRLARPITDDSPPWLKIAEAHQKRKGA